MVLNHEQIKDLLEKCLEVTTIEEIKLILIKIIGQTKDRRSIKIVDTYADILLKAGEERRNQPKRKYEKKNLENSENNSEPKSETKLEKKEEPVKVIEREKYP